MDGVMLFPNNKKIVELNPIQDVYGRITYLEALPGGLIRMWSTSEQGGVLRIVSKNVFRVADFISDRLMVSRFLASHYRWQRGSDTVH